MSAETKLVDNPNFHVWTDALHARELARRARDPWNTGTYVRWTINSAWTAFEMACEDAVEASGLGYRFKENLDVAIAKKGHSALDWGRGLWQRVAAIHHQRIDYTHPGIPQERLFVEVPEAERAIAELREAIKEIYRHAGKKSPAWVEVDEDLGVHHDAVHSVLVTAPGINEATPGVIKIGMVYRGEERITEILPPGSAWEERVKKLIAEVRVPISQVVVYRGDELIFSRDLPMRGSF